MDISQNLKESYSRIQQAVNARARDSNVELSLEKSGPYPLLILKSQGDLVGFAAVDKSPEAAVESAYDAFKVLFRNHRTEWQNRNLSFVICHSSPEKDRHSIFGVMELDAYFCRKYVLNSMNDQSEFDRELLRLPFLPFPDHDGEIAGRPPTARTLLQEYGVSAEMARNLIEPGNRSSARIVKDTVPHAMTLPEIRADRRTEESTRNLPKDKVRLQSLTIEGFRAYRRKQEFNLNADIVVIYGPNGLGKTSFFDAIDYACTGRIGRLCRKKISQKQFQKLARHLDSSSSNGEVTLNVVKDSEKMIVSRPVNEWRYALANSKSIDRPDLLQRLTSSEWGPKRPQVGNLESLFRATHFFSQSHPEFLINFDEYSTISADHVSRALALDDYTSGLSKVKDVIATLAKDEDEQAKILNEIDSKIADSEGRRKSYPATKVTHTPGAQIRGMSKELATDLIEQANVEIRDDEPSSELFREWRALVESRLSDSNTRREQLIALHSGFAKFLSNQKAEKELAKTLASFEKSAKAQQRVLQGCRDKQEENERVQNRLASEITDLRAKKQALERLEQVQNSSVGVGASLQRWQSELALADHELEQGAETQSSLADSVRTLEKQIGDVTTPQANLKQRIDYLTKINSGLSNWKTTRDKIDELNGIEAAKRESIDRINTTIEERNSEVETLKGKLAVLEQELKVGTSRNDRLTQLLDEIEVFAKEEYCPTCGTDHGSNETLIEKIRIQKEARPAHIARLAELCSSHKSNIIEIEATSNSLAVTRDAAVQESLTLASNIETNLHSVGTLERLMTEVGLDPNSSDIQENVNESLAESQTSLASLMESVEPRNKELMDVTSRLTTEKTRNDKLRQSRVEIAASIEALQQQYRDLQEIAASLDLSLEMDSAHRSEDLAKIVESLSEHTDRFDELKSAAKEQKLSMSVAEAELSKILRAQKQTSNDKSTVEQELATYAQRAVDVFGHAEFSDQIIASESSDENERQAKLEALIQRTITLERAIDNAQRTAAIAELDGTMRALSTQRKSVHKKQKRTQAARAWFVQLDHILETQNSSAVDDHVRAFGPLTSIIQKRLRPVHGFGDVRMSAKKKEIHVAVERDGEVIKPTDYFSDSQKQILMLSIFLASRLSQTWSGFAPILMDDPVTHFDDLNAFSFVELIRGLVSSSPGKRQFIVSTCEIRLFELMQKKFQGADGGALFYKFDGMDSDGPVIKRTS